MKKLTCSICGKEIKAGDKFIAEIEMVKPSAMPIGRLDAIISKTATKVVCESCN
ncbi:MAG: hypothetical protein ACLTT7_02985 [Paraclostridium bifermentans]